MVTDAMNNSVFVSNTLSILSQKQYHNALPRGFLAVNSVISLCFLVLLLLYVRGSQTT